MCTPGFQETFSKNVNTFIQRIGAQLEHTNPTRTEFYCNWEPQSGNPIELSLKSPCLHPVFGPAFTPPIPSFSGICKVRKYENPENQRLMHKAKNNYNNCTGKSSENRSSSIQEKGKTG